MKRRKETSLETQMTRPVLGELDTATRKWEYFGGLEWPKGADAKMR